MRAGRILAMGIKWLVVPAALAAAGYYYIGPELGAPRTEPVVIKGADTTGTQTASNKPKRFNSEPEVEVSVRRGTPPPRPRRRRKRSTKPATPAPARESAATNNPPPNISNDPPANG